MKKFKCSKIFGRVDMAEHLDIVFCKNCIKQQSYYHGPDSRLGMFTYYCYANGKHVQPNDFCSEGVRKDKEDPSHPFAESVMMGMDGGENDSK